MKPLFVFIDDAVFELDNFRQNASPALGRAEFIYAQTFDQARERLAGRPPACFLLDLYGTDPAVTRPEIPDRAELTARLAGVGGPADIYQGLDREADPGNAFLRRLYAKVEAWQSAFLAAAGSLGQGRGYGLHNLERARAEYPWAAAAAYSRKALYADAAALSLAGVDLVLQKPQGADESAVAQATRRAAPEMARALYRAVDQSLARALLPFVLPAGAGQAGDQAGDLSRDLAPLLARALASLAAPEPETAADLGRRLDQALDQAPEFPGAPPCRALADWLKSAFA